MRTYTLPTPDATIGITKGWLPSTLDIWNASRPGAQDERAAPGARFLSRKEVAEVIGLASVNSMSKYTLPEPDAIIGKIKGWMPSSIEEWNAPRRPGRGRPRNAERRDDTNS